MFPISVLALLALALFCSSQTIDPSTVDIGTRTHWCADQTAACPILCSQIQNGSQSTSSNNCDPDTLAYACVCTNGQTPPLSQYSLTIPYYECTTSQTQCVNACSTSNTACQANCRTQNKCGAQNPKRVNITTTTSSAASSSATGVAGGQINGAGVSGAASVRAGVVEMGKVYGMAGVLAAVFGGAMMYL